MVSATSRNIPFLLSGFLNIKKHPFSPIGFPQHQETSLFSYRVSSTSRNIPFLLSGFRNIKKHPFSPIGFPQHQETSLFSYLIFDPPYCFLLFLSLHLSSFPPTVRETIILPVTGVQIQKEKMCSRNLVPCLLTVTYQLPQLLPLFILQ